VQTLQPVVTADALTRNRFSATSLGRGAFILLGVSLPVATFGDVVLTFTILVAWLAALRFRDTAEAIRSNPVALFAVVWVFVHAIGALYSVGTPAEVWRGVTKSAIFLLIPVAVIMVKRDRDVRLAHYAFMSAIGVTMLLSYLRWAGVIPHDAPLLKDAGYSASVVFKYHLTQNLLLAYGAFLFAVYARSGSTRNMRLFFGACATLTAVNVVFIGDGRTGQVALMVLAVYYSGWLAGKKGVAAGIAAVIVIGLVAYALPGSSLHKRAALAISDAEQWQPGTRAEPSGVKERLEFYRRALTMLEHNPWIGVGTGGFAAADRAAASRVGMPPTAHPHNDYLLQGVELGAFGILLLIALYGFIWREAGRLDNPAQRALARGLVLMYASASFGTSMLNDHTETLLFVWMNALLFAGYHGARVRRA